LRVSKGRDSPLKKREHNNNGGGGERREGSFCGAKLSSQVSVEKKNDFIEGARKSSGLQDPRVPPERNGKKNDRGDFDPRSYRLAQGPIQKTSFILRMARGNSRRA